MAVARAPAASANTEDIIAPSPMPPQGADRGQRLAGGHLHERLAGLLGRHARTSSSKKPAAPPPGRLHPVHRRNNEPPGENTGRRTEDRPRRPAGRAQRQPAGDPAVHAGRIRSGGRLQSRIPGRRKRGHRLAPRCRNSPRSPASPKCPSTTSNPPHGHPARFGLRPGRQRSLPRSRRRLRRRLPRGLHDRRAGTRRSSAKRSSKTAWSSTGAPATAPSSPRRAPATTPKPNRPHEHVYSTYLLAASVAEEAKPGYQFPASAEPALESPLPQGKKPIDCEHDPLRPDDRARPGHRPKPTRPRARSPKSTCPTHRRRRRTRDSSNTKEAQVALPAGHGPQPLGGATACSPAPTHSSARAPATPVACPPGLEGRHGRDRNAAAAAERLAHRQRLRRQAAEPRPGLGRRVPDLRRRRVGPLRALGAADRQGQRRPGDRPADDHASSELPQVPFSSFTLQLDGGPTATLTSPPTCGPHTVDGDDDSLDRATRPATPSSANSP